MKLISIEGNLWQLSCLHEGGDKYADEVREEVNESLIDSKRTGCYRGIIRFFPSNKLRSMAYAVIEITVNGQPHCHTYNIYKNSKGFYCVVQKQTVYLNTINKDAYHAN